VLAAEARISGQSNCWMGHVTPAVADIIESEYVKHVNLSIYKSSLLPQKKT
jgi:hypothetical protein